MRALFIVFCKCCCSHRGVIVTAAATNIRIGSQSVNSACAFGFGAARAIAIPKISESGRKLANLCKIYVIEVKTPREAVEKFKAYLPL